MTKRKTNKMRANTFHGEKKKTVLCFSGNFVLFGSFFVWIKKIQLIIVDIKIVKSLSILDPSVPWSGIAFGFKEMIISSLMNIN